MIFSTSLIGVNNMLRKLTSLIALTCALFASHSFAEATIDQAAPTFSAKAADGSSIDLASLKGKTVVLEWTNNECPFVKKHYDKSGNIPALQKDFTVKGIVWLQV